VVYFVIAIAIFHDSYEEVLRKLVNGLSFLGSWRDDATKWTTEVAYAVTSLAAEQATPTQLATWVRGHWHIENRLHWVRDITFDEDRSPIRSGNGPRVMVSLRNLVINILRVNGTHQHRSSTTTTRMGPPPSRHSFHNLLKYDFAGGPWWRQ
jgi:predicted transposase YbfD/YdcC